MKEIDLYRSAHLLIEQHEDNAPQEASRMMAELMEKGDYEGALIWLKIREVIDNMANVSATVIH